MAVLLTGVVEKFFDVSNANFTNAVVNSAESTAYITDAGTSGAVIRSVPLQALNSSTVVLASGITSPQGLTLSIDETQLYVISTAGIIYQVTIASGAVTQLANVGSAAGNITTGWRRIIRDPMSNSHLLITNTSRKFIWRLNLTNNTLERFYDFPFFVQGIGFDRSNNTILWLGAYVSSASNGRLIKVFRDSATGTIARWQLFAGSGAGTSTTNGEVLRVANVTAPTQIQTPPDGTIIYMNNTFQAVTGGQLSRLATGYAAAQAFTILPNANKALVATAAFRLSLVN